MTWRERLYGHLVSIGLEAGDGDGFDVLMVSWMLVSLEPVPCYRRQLQEWQCPESRVRGQLEEVVNDGERKNKSPVELMFFCRVPVYHASIGKSGTVQSKLLPG